MHCIKTTKERSVKKENKDNVGNNFEIEKRKEKKTTIKDKVRRNVEEEKASFCFVT